MRKKKKEERIFDGPDYVVEVHDPKDDVIDEDVEKFFDEIMSKDVDIDTENEYGSDLDFYLSFVKETEKEDKEIWNNVYKLFEDTVNSDNYTDD